MACSVPQRVVKLCPEIELSENEYTVFQALTAAKEYSQGQLATAMVRGMLYGMAEITFENQPAKRDRLLKLLKQEG